MGQAGGIVFIKSGRMTKSGFGVMTMTLMSLFLFARSMRRLAERAHQTPANFGADDDDILWHSLPSSYQGGYHEGHSFPFYDFSPARFSPTELPLCKG